MATKAAAKAAPKKAEPKAAKPEAKKPSFEDQVRDFLAVVEEQKPDFVLEKLKSQLRHLLPPEPGEAVSWGE